MPADGPMRADARDNRERILAVALELLTASGDASLNSIAKAAGVGPGTLYRHFPTREALVLEVYRVVVQQLVDSAPELLRELPPDEALRAWVMRLAEHGMTKAGLRDALSAAWAGGLLHETYPQVAGALTALLAAGEAAGALRPGLDPDDVLLLLGALWRVDPAGDWRARSARLLDLVMDGITA